MRFFCVELQNGIAKIKTHQKELVTVKFFYAELQDGITKIKIYFKTT